MPETQKWVHCFKTPLCTQSMFILFDRANV